MSIPAEAPVPDRSRDSGAFPRVVLIDTCSFCNLRCSMCVHKEMSRTKGFMPWPLFTKLIDEIAAVDKSTRVWLVFFGEPLVARRRKPTIFDMIAYAKDRRLEDVVINSNGNLLDEAASRALIEAGLDAIYVGIDAFDPTTYAKLRVGGDYTLTVSNVLGLMRLKSELGVERPQVFVQFVEMPENSSEKDAFRNFWTRAGAIVKIRPKVSWAGKIDAPNLALPDSERRPCYWGMQTMSVTDTGKVVTCAVDLDARFVAGDVTTQSLSEIWNGKLRELRRLQASGRYADLPQPCRDCRDWQSARADFYAN